MSLFRQYELGQKNNVDNDLDVLQAIDVETTNIEDLPGFDNSAGSKWIYPTNYPERKYQFTITEKALYNNTLVSLPTGMQENKFNMSTQTFIFTSYTYNRAHVLPLLSCKSV